MLLFFGAHMLPAQATVGTIGAQLEAKDGTAAEAAAHTRAYSAIFAASALSTPVAGWAIDRFGFVPVMGVVNGMLALCYAVLMLPYLDAQPVAYLCYSVGRVCLWALFFAYNAATFGFRHYGKLAGGGLAFGASLSLLQYAALEAVVGPLGGDFLFVNLAWCAIAILNFGAIWALARALRASREADEAAAAKGAEGAPA
jgi:MFS family permease